MAILTKLQNKDFEEILENYKIGEHKSHKHLPWALGNTVYLLKTTRGKFILKIFENAKKDFIEFQLKIMQLMEKEKLPSPRVMMCNDGPLLIFNKKKIVIQKFVEGKPAKRFTRKLIEDIAEKHGRLNRALMKMGLEGKHTWKKDYQFKPLMFDVIRHEGFEILKENKKLREELKQINKKKLRRSVVHGDFNRGNLLVKNQKLNAIIDLDDAHEDFVVQEISNFITMSFIDWKGRVDYGKIKLYLKGFEKYFKLNPSEREAIYFFIKHRFQGIIGWHVSQLKKHSDMEKRLRKAVKKWIRKYEMFCETLAEEFSEGLG
ncbi:phosphotransferase [archaeon]|jgi:homoserine kinase type II|nr:phosphotransferase [archaeon]MBT3577371.1 phosphotransferase [archaeon]MBT6820386.1 phosphotransferase [archaeon]MBT7025200.1 phosphotransferase [archaeon]MBT7238795.1 phosphotransferase [archaeon]